MSPIRCPSDALRYDWDEVSGRAADVYFPNDDDNSHSASRILVAFRRPGTYRLRARIIDVSGWASAEGDEGTEVTVTVDRVLSYVKEAEKGTFTFLAIL